MQRKEQVESLADLGAKPDVSGNKEGIKAAVAILLTFIGPETMGAGIAAAGFAIAGIELGFQAPERAIRGSSGDNERKKYRDALDDMVTSMINRETIKIDGKSYTVSLTPEEETGAQNTFLSFSEEMIWKD